MRKRDDLTSNRTQELIDLGYKPGVVILAVEWAVGCAEGMANYALKGGDSESDDIEGLILQLLPRYLQDCEKWIQAFGHTPKE